MRTGYIALLVLGWSLIASVIYLPATEVDLLQSLWVKSWWWIAVLGVCSGRLRRTAWRRSDTAVRVLLMGAAALIVTNILVDYVLIVRVLKLTVPEIIGSVKSLATHAPYLGSLLPGVAAGVALVRNGTANDPVR